MALLDGLPESPEARVVKNFHRVLKNDSRLSMFNPIRLAELPYTSAASSALSIPEFAAFTLVVTPTRLVIERHPSHRDSIGIEIMVGFFIPSDQTTVDSRLPGLNLFNLVRIIAEENAELRDSFTGDALTYATVDAELGKLLPRPDEDTWVVWGRVTLHTEINSLTGEII